ncbi:two-component system sensor histidine kinase NtrB [Haloarchaeobius sp. TZWWS8]|uniref:two-component system sensor histidine kinase NtrB n=1 Tax=Haloarchaeobius sp. TZWWS8 TaxID=3446121 RepID=UPI003EBF9119
MRGEHDDVLVLVMEDGARAVPEELAATFTVRECGHSLAKEGVDCAVVTSPSTVVLALEETAPGTPVVAIVPDDERQAAVDAGATLAVATGADEADALVRAVEVVVARRRGMATDRLDAALTEEADDSPLVTDHSGLLAVTEAVPDLIIVYDAEGRYVEIKTNQQVLDFDIPEDVIGRYVDDVLPEQAARDIRSVITETLRTGTGQQLEYELEFRGETFSLEARTQPVSGVDEEYVVFVAREISERKAYERELERKNERLEAFADVIGHDLRNPLTVARGNLELAKLTGEIDRLEPVEESLDRMTELVEDMLALARHGRDVDDPRPTNLADVARQSWGMVDATRASLLVDDDLGIALADDSRLRQLFENLFRNAVEHAGDDVSIRVVSKPDGFYVVDDGPGISPDDRDHVFTQGYSTNDEGTGFGLAIVADIVEAHGWELELCDPPESMAGACIEVTGLTFV